MSPFATAPPLGGGAGVFSLYSPPPTAAGAERRSACCRVLARRWKDLLVSREGGAGAIMVNCCTPKLEAQRPYDPENLEDTVQ
mmetsp:Transcript_1278/g.1499  ORF Transcript_1278/g.1499 Transcript_1278/m.1499 type:complete len:83 (+) Transcript_1278:2550-2798(+)